MSLTIQEKINNFVSANSDLKGKSEQVILSVMLNNGAISRAEYEKACKGSAFGVGFSDNSTMGLSIEHTENPEKPQNIEQSEDYTISYENGKIKSKKAKDGSEETTYTYLRNDDGIEFVVVHTVLDNGSEITSTALYVNPETGEISNTDFLNRTTIKPDGTVIVLSNDTSLNGALREVIVSQDKTTTNIYNSADIEKYDNRASEPLNRVAQGIEINDHLYKIQYDGEGNTFVVLQNGDCISNLIKDFKVTKQQLDQLNKSNFDYKNMQVGGIIRIPNEIEADDNSVKNRKTSQESKQEFFNWSVKQEQADLFTCTISKHTIQKKHTSVESLAREILPNGTKEQIRTLALRLQMINKDLVKNLKAGTEITVALEGDKNAINVAKSAGFEPSKENNAFYQVLNNLPEDKRTKALSAIQACKKANIKDLTEIKNRVFAQTGISLFDSGKTVKYGDSDKPLEHALQSFGIDTNDFVGQAIYQRLSSIPQENLNQIDLKKVRSLLGNRSNVSMDQIFIAFENAGMSIMTKDEIQNNSVNIMGGEIPISQISKLRTQNFATKIVESQYDQAISILRQYKDDSGMVAKLYESFARGVDKNIGGTHSVSQYIKLLEDEKNRIIKDLENSKIDNDSNFFNIFKATTGIDFSQKDVQNFLDIVNRNVDPNTPEYQNAYKKAFGTRLTDSTSEFVKGKSFWAGCGNLTLSIYAMMNPLARSATSSIAGGLASSGLGTLSSSAIANSIIMGGSTALVEGLDLAVKDSEVSTLDISNYIQSVGISTGFGAFAGYMSPVFQKVCSSVSTKAATKFPKLFKSPDAKKLEAVIKPLESGKAINGADLMATYLTTSGSNIAGKSAEFITEIIAFTGYSIPAGMIAKFTALAFDKDGTLKAQYNNEESLLGLIKQEFGHQVQGLLSCKGLTKILMAFCSKNNTATAMMQEKLNAFESLKNIEFKYTEVNGQKVLIAKTQQGNFKINSPAEAIDLCQKLTTIETAITMDKSIQEQTVNEQPQNNPQETAMREGVNSLIEKYSSKEEYLNDLLNKAELNQIGKMSSRIKSEQSLYDKIKNYLEDNPNATVEDAIKSVRDAFGARTVVESQDFTNHPEVKALIESGDMQGAMRRAAELQSAPALEKLKGMILAQVQGEDSLKTARISNYVSENGIPYFSEAQLAELKQFGAEHGVNIDYVVKVDKSDPLYAKMKAEGKKPTTKAQPSGYTALQINFVTESGEIMEWQFRGDKVNEFAEGEHIPYDLRTNKNIIGSHKELEPLYNPIKELLSKDSMSDETYQEYNRYLTDYYTHLRKLELGFESTEPRLEDYGNGYEFDIRLKAENLITLHEVADKLKKGNITQEEALQEYYETITFNPNSVEPLMSEASPVQTPSSTSQRTTEESLKIIESMCTTYPINDFFKQQLLQYPEALNSMPLEAMKKVGFPVAYLAGLIKNWKPEFANLPFDKIDTSGKMVNFINSLYKDPTGQTQIIASPFHQIQLGKPGVLGTIRFFDFSPLKNADGSFDMAKVTEYFKSIKNAPKVDAILEPIKQMFEGFGDIDAMAKDYPQFTKYLIEAFNSGMFNDQNILKFISNLNSNNLFNQNSLKIFEQFLNEGYSLQNKCNFSEMYMKASLSNSYTTNNCAFNKLDVTTKNNLLNEILKTSTPLFISENNLYKLLATHIDSSEIINKICSDSKLRGKLINNINSLESTFAYQNGIDISIKNKIKINLALMQEFNPEGFVELTHSKGYKEIKKGSLSAKLLENLKFDEKIDDNYFYNLFEGIETKTKQSIANNPILAEYDADLVNQIIEIDPSRQDEILDWLTSAKDKTLVMNDFKEFIKIYKTIQSNIEKNNKEGNITSPKEIQEYNDAILALLKLDCKNPKLLKVTTAFNPTGIIQQSKLANKLTNCKLSLDDTNNLIETLVNNRTLFNFQTANTAIEFAEKYGNDKLTKILEHFKQYGKVDFGYILNSISENNIDYVMEHIGPGKFKPHVTELLYTVKDMPEFKDPQRREEILEVIGKVTEDTKTSMIACIGLIDLKLNNPAKYDKIMDSGILDLIKSRKVNPCALTQLNRNSDLSEDIYNDIELLKSGKSIVTEFKAGTPIEEAFAQSKCGDAVEIGEKMFINDGNSLVEWNMTKEKFLELFPPVERFATVQGNLGDCYLVSSLSSCMNNPIARAQLYKSFSLNGNDVTVTIKGYEDFNGSHTFPNGEVPKTNRQLIGCKGLQMLERTYAQTALRSLNQDFLPSLEVTANSLMQRIQGGYSHQALSELLGLENRGFNTKLPKDGPKKESSICLVRQNQANIEKYLEEYSNNPNIILNFGTLPAQKAEINLLKEYNLVSSHAYSILGYDPTTKTVKIANPHGFSVVTEIPVDIFSKYVNRLFITKLN